MARPNPHEVHPDLAVFLDGGYHGLSTGGLSRAQIIDRAVNLGESFRTLLTGGQIAVASLKHNGTGGEIVTSENFDVGDHHDNPVSAYVNLSISYRHALETDEHGNRKVVVVKGEAPAIPTVIAIGASVELADPKMEDTQSKTFAVLLSAIHDNKDVLPSLHRVRWNPELVEFNRDKFMGAVLAGCITNPPMLT